MDTKKDIVVSQDCGTRVIINQIIIPERKEFLTLAELVKQIPLGKTKIMQMIRKGELKNDIHYTIRFNKYMFYFPEVVAFFKPRLSKK